ncbi:TetR/AcrR family transcriptional regulator [Parabacteroides bouchesdurhonensis]|uniref:TetR/AcrR family transcriptional regulator n=1 Tax=Parabacteroides bouchesdurhonensis TaxID=1936995 RepID=UPI000C8575FE|nr:TetR/AcrR family transcriptional regulator [Parabacteroides bouchesdurhonensis]RHJ95278.1 TetR/AcrR family transcriptional regulator [Bacteroides sp. AM07-16]
MLKDQILITAFDLFSQYGVKSVSMDDIAHKMGISKRTIYESFKDKEMLLVEGIIINNNRLKLFLEQLEKEPYTVLDVILLFYEELLKSPRWYSKRFYEDLKKYPRALKLTEINKEAISKKCLSLFERGTKEGVFLSNINYGIVALLAKEQAKMLRPSRIFEKYSITEVYSTILLTFLRGISTEKGRIILNRFALKQAYKAKQKDETIID